MYTSLFNMRLNNNITVDIGFAYGIVLTVSMPNKDNKDSDNNQDLVFCVKAGPPSNEKYSLSIDQYFNHKTFKNIKEANEFLLQYRKMEFNETTVASLGLSLSSKFTDNPIYAAEYNCNITSENIHDFINMPTDFIVTKYLALDENNKEYDEVKSKITSAINLFYYLNFTTNIYIGPEHGLKLIFNDRKKWADNLEQLIDNFSRAFDALNELCAPALPIPQDTKKAMAKKFILDGFNVLYNTLNEEQEQIKEEIPAPTINKTQDSGENTKTLEIDNKFYDIFLPLISLWIKYCQNDELPNELIAAILEKSSAMSGLTSTDHIKSIPTLIEALARDKFAYSKILVTTENKLKESEAQSKQTKLELEEHNLDSSAILAATKSILQYTETHLQETELRFKKTEVTLAITNLELENEKKAHQEHNAHLKEIIELFLDCAKAINTFKPGSKEPNQQLLSLTNKLQALKTQDLIEKIKSDPTVKLSLYKDTVKEFVTNSEKWNNEFLLNIQGESKASNLHYFSQIIAALIKNFSIQIEKNIDNQPQPIKHMLLHDKNDVKVVYNDKDSVQDINNSDTASKYGMELLKIVNTKTTEHYSEQQRIDLLKLKAKIKSSMRDIIKSKVDSEDKFTPYKFKTLTKESVKKEDSYDINNPLIAQDSNYLLLAMLLQTIKQLEINTDQHFDDERKINALREAQLDNERESYALREAQLELISKNASRQRQIDALTEDVAQLATINKQLEAQSSTLKDEKEQTRTLAQEQLVINTKLKLELQKLTSENSIVKSQLQEQKAINGKLTQTVLTTESVLTAEEKKNIFLNFLELKSKKTQASDERINDKDADNDKPKHKPSHRRSRSLSLIHQ